MGFAARWYNDKKVERAVDPCYGYASEKTIAVSGLMMADGSNGCMKVRS